MALVRPQRGIIVKQLAESIGVSGGNPQFTSLLKYLVQLGIVEYQDTFSPAKIVTVHRGKLRDFIDEQNIVNLFYDYFNTYHKCIW
jgi:hypothetical protein